MESYKKTISERMRLLEAGGEGATGVGAGGEGATGVGAGGEGLLRMRC